MLIFSWHPPSYFLLDVYCTYSIYVHCTKISNLCVQALETGRKVTLLFGYFAASANEFYFYGPMHVFYVYPEISNSSK
jgi:hypothetical protein